MSPRWYQDDTQRYRKDRNGLREDHDTYSGTISPAHGRAPRLGRRDGQISFPEALARERFCNRTLADDEVSIVALAISLQPLAWSRNICSMGGPCMKARRKRTPCGGHAGAIWSVETVEGLAVILGEPMR
jgi:hypothetical protein